jgi:hypothetical protein
MITYAALSLNEFVDSMLVSNLLDSDAMGVINLGLPVVLVMSAAYAMLGTGGANEYAVSLGKRDHEAAGKSFTASVAFALIIGFLIMLIAMIFIFMLGIDVSWLQIAGIGFLVLFLSVGAPNQPGSIVIGILIITFYLKADGLITIAIFAEVFFGSVQNIINVLGDIVTVAIEEQKYKLKSNS